MQDDTNLRRPPKYNTCAKGKSVYPKRKVTPQKIKRLLWKIFYCSFHTLNTQTCQILSLLTDHFHCHYLHLPQPHSLHSHSLHCHSIWYTALFKMLHNHFWWDAPPSCSDPHWLNKHLYFLVYKLNWIPWRRFTILSTYYINGVKNCKFILCCVYGLIRVSSWLFLWLLICWLVQVLFLSHVFNFKIFNSHFPVTILGLDLF